LTFPWPCRSPMNRTLPRRRRKFRSWRRCTTCRCSCTRGRPWWRWCRVVTCTFRCTCIALRRIRCCHCISKLRHRGGTRAAQDPRLTAAGVEAISTERRRESPKQTAVETWRTCAHLSLRTGSLECSSCCCSRSLKFRFGCPATVSRRCSARRNESRRSTCHSSDSKRAPCRFG
jgi:hypothetical protein